MLYPTALVADALADRLVQNHREMFGAREPECADFVAVAARSLPRRRPRSLRDRRGGHDRDFTARRQRHLARPLSHRARQARGARPARQPSGHRCRADRAHPLPGAGYGRIEPFIGDALRCLRRTMAGKDWTAHLYANVFTVEHQLRALGPEPRDTGDAQ
jgi:hypothetical protein